MAKKTTANKKTSQRKTSQKKTSRKKTARRSASSKIPVAQLAAKLLNAKTTAKSGESGVPRVVTIAGNEDFLIREATDLVLESLFGARHDASSADHDVTRLSGSKTLDVRQVVELFDDLKTPSLFGGDRVIVIDRAEHYLAIEPDAWARLLDQGWGAAHLILRAEKLDGRTKVPKLLGECGWWINCDRPYHRPPPWQPRAPLWDNPLNEWLRERASRQRVTLDPPTAQMMITRIGPSLADLDALLSRLITVLEPGQRIDDQLVDKHAPSGEDSTLFELVDTLFEGHRERTLQLTREILRRGVVDSRGQRVVLADSMLVQFIGALSNRVRQLREVARVIARGGGDDEIMAAAGVRSFLVSSYRRQAAKLPPERCQRIIDELAHADWALKSGAGPTATELFERIAVRA